MYIINCTFSDIFYAVNKFSGFTNNLGDDHWKALIRVLRYLWFISNVGLSYNRYLDVLEGYTNVSWISYTNDSKCTGGYVFIIVVRFSLESLQNKLV